MPPPSDSELANRVRVSDAEAFRLLFYRYHEPIYGYCFRRLGDADRASDVAQDVFAKIWETRDRIRSDKPIRAYLYRLAHNRIVDLYRADAVRRDFAAESEAEASVPQADYFAVEEDVRTAIDALPAHVRTTFVLSRYDELTYAEISRLLGVSVKAVEKRMSQALKALRRELAHLLSLLLTFYWTGW